MKNTVVDKDWGFTAIMTRLMRLRQKPHVEIGVLNAEEEHEDSTLTVAEIAAIHEFGSDDGKIPQRSFIRSAYDDNLAENRKLIRKLHWQVLEGERTEQSALTMVGEVVKGQMVSKINSGVGEKLADSTIKRKKSSKQLIHSGQLKGSINHDVKV